MDSYRDLALRIGQAINSGDLDLIDECVTPDFADLSAPPGTPCGAAAYKDLFTLIRGAFTEPCWELLDIAAEDDTVALRVRFSGTHTGPFMDLAPTGRSICVEHAHFFRGRDGRLATHTGVRDDLAMLRQLGVIPAA